MCIIPNNVVTSNVENNDGNFGLKGEGRQERDIDKGGVVNIDKSGQSDGY